MKQIKKVYLVQSACGEYEDYCTSIEGVFARREDAEEFAKRFDNTHLLHRIFDGELFERIYDAFNEKYDDKETCEYFGETYDDLLYFIGGLYADTDKYNKIFDHDLFIKLLETAREFAPDITRETLIRYIEAKQYNYCNTYYPCEIKEFELNYSLR